MHFYMYVYACMCWCMLMYVHAHIYMLCMYVCMYVRLCVCTYVYVHILKIFSFASKWISQMAELFSLFILILINIFKKKNFTYGWLPVSGMNFP